MAAPPYHPPLFYSTTAPSYHLSLYHSPIPPPYHSTTLPCFTAPLYHCFTVPLHNRPVVYLICLLLSGLWPLAIVYHERHVNLILRVLNLSAHDIDMLPATRKAAVTAYELFGESCVVRGLHDKAGQLFSEMVKYTDRYVMTY